MDPVSLPFHWRKSKLKCLLSERHMNGNGVKEGLGLRFCRNYKEQEIKSKKTKSKER